MTVTEQPEQELTPEQEAQVRRLLADARHTEPTPEAVVARLGKVLSGLADEPARSAKVVRLADRRRRAATMLVAAAAVVAVGVGLGQVIPDGGGSEDAASTAEDGPAAVSGNNDLEEMPGSEAAPDEGGVPRDADALRPLKLSPREFAPQAARLQAPALLGDYAYDAQGLDDGGLPVTGSVARAARDVCEPGAWGRGRFVPVVYDKAPGWLVLRKPQGDSQIADLFLCGSEVVVRSVTLPYP